MESVIPWYKDAIFYEVYVRAFYDSNGDGHGDLNGLAQKLEYLQELGVDCLWLLPIYPSPLRDDGYDISDYYNIHPAYGTLEDFRALLEAVHRRGMHLIMDLVLNHTSSDHPWFQSSRSSRTSPHRDFYVWSDSDRKYQEARIIFLDTEKSNWTFDPAARQFYWHRFYASQPDLNFDNPAVQEEMLQVVDFWLSLGVDGFRVDAVPYLFEREGTNCENLPETHQYLKRLRQFVQSRYPGRLLLCEANQWPQEVRAYFGEGDEFDMAFNFPLMPRVFMALKKSDRTPIVWALEHSPPIPDNCQWGTFLRNHDELTLEMVSPEEREWMWEQYAPLPRMRLNLGIRRRLAPLLDNNQKKIELAYSLAFTLPGSPFIYYGDEIGMGDNIDLEDRNGVRTPMQWSRGAQAGFTSAADPYLPVIQQDSFGPERINAADQTADPRSLFTTLKKMISVRKSTPALRSGTIQWLSCSERSIAAFARRLAGGQAYLVHNLSDHNHSIELPLADSPLPLQDLLSRRLFPVEGGLLRLSLKPFEYLWLGARIRTQARSDPGAAGSS